MITNFNKETEPLTAYERDTLLPIFIRCLKKKVGRENAVTNAQICSSLKKFGLKITPVLVRKIINHIRRNGSVKRLVASSDGYYVSNDKKELEAYIYSLSGRESAIREVRRCLEQQINEPIELFQ